jgi:hypothetical protein
MKTFAISALVLIVLALFSIGGAVSLGGPREIAALDSINKPFADIDFSTVPKTSRFTARDGTQLSYHHNPLLYLIDTFCYHPI